MFGSLQIAACGEKIGETEGASASDSTGAETSGGAATDSGSASSTVASTEVTTGPSTDPTMGATGGSTTAGGGACDCADDQLCAWTLKSCGEDPQDVGACEPRPVGCDPLYAPVCGCDGEVYGNSCEAAKNGVDVAEADGCPAPEGFFACGPLFCDVQFTYCEIQLSDVGGFPDLHACRQLPDACDPQACACLEGVLCGETCEPVDGGGLKVTCPGG